VASLNLNVVVHSVDIEEGETLVMAPGAAVPVKQRTTSVSAVLRSTEGPHVELIVSHVDPAAFGATVTENAKKQLELSGIKMGDAFTITLAGSASAVPAAPAAPPATSVPAAVVQPAPTAPVTPAAPVVAPPA